MMLCYHVIQLRGESRSWRESSGDWRRAGQLNRSNNQMNKTFCIPESFKTNILHQPFDYKTIFVKSQLKFKNGVISWNYYNKNKPRFSKTLRLGFVFKIKHGFQSY